MATLVIAVLLLLIAVGAICLILKSMGEDGIEIAAPGSCKSGRCGVRCAPRTMAQDQLDEIFLTEDGAVKRKEMV